jgi:hypothetical protein
MGVKSGDGAGELQVFRYAQDDTALDIAQDDLADLRRVYW